MNQLLKDPDYDWPDNFPDGVPPADALPADGVLYRLVRELPPTPEDFRQTRHDYPEREFPPDREVDSYGTSFHRTAKASRRTRMRYKGLRDRVVAEGKMSPADGKQKDTGGPDHVTVWLCQSAAAHLRFTTDRTDR